ncbi:cbb3-type cytochrome c oxidase subunit I [Pyrobaculum ferrireducens]|uniref:Cytochrome-c oxidase n=1 Tax=Pyrobaculum ferrireducens TaxID=1104324 RepID=G7VI94_9CREN|nr:cbb3-type cytochrome c oxidase subunit I [Pyrobaculum ferrireducens]AET32186.1 Cytochrome-c oxidase [Pyrobaculum ferrireducens]
MATTPKFAVEDRFARVAILFSFVMLALGSLFGLVQALTRFPGLLHALGLDKVITPELYYTGLTLHGVANAILFTAFFIMGLAVFVVTRDMNINLHGPLLRLACMMAIGGTLVAAVPILLGQATVLYTFYPPLNANVLFYLGLAVVVVASWIFAAVVFHGIYRWKKANPDKEIPLGVWGVITTLVIWLYATPPLAYEVLFLLVPMSLAGMPVDVLEARLWFWYFGHPLVYFWLLPAVTLWYTLLPRVLGTEVFSKTMAKVAFVLYMIFSTPVGLHHQYVDPGVHPVFKYLHATLTYFVAVPSFLTAFNLIATLERAGRARGGKGLFGWVTALPWFKDPVFTGLALAIIIFGTGGFSGVINASFQINYVVHNTMWIPGHFHTTVGSGVALSFLTASLVLIPLLYGRQIVSMKTVKAAFVLWFVGIMLFSVGGYLSGLAGEPRRTYAPPYLNGVQVTAHLLDLMKSAASVAMSGALMFWLGGALFLGTLFFSVLFGKRVAFEGEVKISPEPGPASWFEKNLKLILIVGVVLILISYSLPAIEVYSQGLSPAPPQGPLK